MFILVEMGLKYVMGSLVLPLSLVVPTTIAARLLYNMLKIPKQDSHLLKHILYSDTGQPIIMAHRGGQYEAAENTLLAIETANKNGAKAVEIDLEFTKDGIPILFHDDHVDRVTDGSGRVNDQSFKQICQLNAAKVMNYTLTRSETSSISIVTQNILIERIPTLKEAIKLCTQFDMVINLDVKSNATQTVFILKELIETIPNIHEKLFITSFKPYIIYKVRNACPELQAGLLYEYNSYEWNADSSFIKRTIYSIANSIYYSIVHSWLTDFLGVSFVSVESKLLSRYYISEWRGKDIDVLAWTVNHPKEKEYLLNVLKTPIITDTILDVRIQ